MNLLKSKSILVILSIISFASHFTFAQDDEAEIMVFSADGKYTNDNNYSAVKVLDSKITVENSSILFSGSLVNSGKASLERIELVLDIYGSHELIKSSYIPIYQCKSPLGEKLLVQETVNFSGLCENIPENILAKIKKHRISIGKK